jgi:hypothetical protein
MTKAADTLMVHSVGANPQTNAARYGHNSIQGHHHSVFGIAYNADMNNLRWHMSVGCLLDQNSPAARYGTMAVLKRPVLGCGVIIGDDGNFLVISDLHIPYHHPASFDFLEKVHYEYSCDFVLNVGDVVDNHSGSYHESEPDAMGAEEEYEATKVAIQDLQDLFPVMTITKGNHCMIPQRKAKSAGLPATMVGDFNQLYDLNDGWDWVDTHKFNSGNGRPSLVPMRLTKKGWDGDVRAL